MVAILVLLTIIAFLTLDYFAQQRAVRRAATAGAPSAGVAAVPPVAVLRPEPPDLVDAPGGLFWAPWHTWAQVEPKGTVRIGAGRLPLAALGAPERLDVLAAGTTVRAGETVATLRRGAREIRLRAPVAGVIDHANPRLAAHPAALDTDPYGEGWLCSIRPRNLAGALRSLRVAEDARNWLRSEVRRLRDFLTVVQLRDPACAVVTLPDGGLPLRGLAPLLDDREWQDLVDRFFDAHGPVPEPHS